MTSIIAVRTARNAHEARRTAEINEVADAVSCLSIGDGVSVSVWSDVDAYTIIKQTPTSMTLREDKAVLSPDFKPQFIAGGFAGHCINQREQTYSYEPNPEGSVIKITLRRWKDENGEERRRWKRTGVGTFEMGGSVFAGRRKFHDYNF
jgi:hypothetical protein